MSIAYTATQEIFAERAARRAQFRAALTAPNSSADFYARLSAARNRAA